MFPNFILIFSLNCNLLRLFQTIVCICLTTIYGGRITQKVKYHMINDRAKHPTNFYRNNFRYILLTTLPEFVLALFHLSMYKIFDLFLRVKLTCVATLQSIDYYSKQSKVPFCFFFNTIKALKPLISHANWTIKVNAKWVLHHHVHVGVSLPGELFGYLMVI